MSGLERMPQLLQQLRLPSRRSTMPLFHIPAVRYESCNAQREVQCVAGSKGPHLPLSNLGMMARDAGLLLLKGMLTHCNGFRSVTFLFTMFCRYFAVILVVFNCC
jgi:hypothetical protein